VKSVAGDFSSGVLYGVTKILSQNWRPPSLLGSSRPGVTGALPPALDASVKELCFYFSHAHLPFASKFRTR